MYSRKKAKRSIEYEYIKFFAGRGGRTRRNIINILIKSSENHLDIAEKIGDKPTNVRRHLLRLIDSKLDIIKYNSNNSTYFLGDQFNKEIYKRICNMVENNELYQSATYKTFGHRFLIEYKKFFETFTTPKIL